MKIIMTQREAEGLDAVIRTQNKEITVLQSVDLPRFKVDYTHELVTVEANEESIMGLLQEIYNIGKGTKCLNILASLQKGKNAFSKFVHSLSTPCTESRTNSDARSKRRLR